MRYMLTKTERDNLPAEHRMKTTAATNFHRQSPNARKAPRTDAFLMPVKPIDCRRAYALLPPSRKILRVTKFHTMTTAVAKILVIR